MSAKIKLMLKGCFLEDFDQFEVEFDGIPRFGLVNEDPDCGDPTLIVWDNEGTAVLSIHLGSINFDQDPRAAEEEFWEDVAKSMNP